jgi:glycerophosphoryl diester phosphodiesterase
LSNFLLFAKAGGSREAPENTCEAVARAALLKAPAGVEVAIEVDLRLSAGGELVALHDAGLERTTNGRGLVRRLSSREICRLVAGPGGERVPTLSDVLDAALGCSLLLELQDDDVCAARAIHNELRRLPPGQRERVCVASEHHRVVEAMRRLDPTLRTAATKREAWAMLLLGRLGLGRLAPRGHVWVVPERHAGLQVVTSQFVERARRAGDSVWAFVIDDATALRRLRELGVAGCLTTRPSAMLEALATL